MSAPPGNRPPGTFGDHKPAAGPLSDQDFASVMRHLDGDAEVAIRQATEELDRAIQVARELQVKLLQIGKDREAALRSHMSHAHGFAGAPSASEPQPR